MELISIGREDFYDIFMAKRGEEPEHIRFLRGCPFTEYFPLQSLLQNPQYCLFHYYKYVSNKFFNLTGRICLYCKWSILEKGK